MDGPERAGPIGRVNVSKRVFQVLPESVFSAVLEK
jgi:hypothetical protein